MWYHTVEGTFLYEGDLALLGLTLNEELPSEIVPLKWTEKPISDDILVDYVMDIPVLINGVYEVAWSKITHSNEELLEIQKTQEELSKKTIDYLLNRVW
jgi:hypothetical protein